MRWTDSSARRAVVMVLALGAGAPAAADSARSLYEKAQRAEQRLMRSQKLQAQRSAWMDVARQYHQVVLSHPRSGYCDDALYYEGEIYRQAAARFGSREAAVRALDAYRLLIQGYPGSKWCPRAHLARADVYLKRLADEERAAAELKTVLGEWPRAPEALEARRVLDQIEPPPPPRAAAGAVEVRNIRHWTGNEYTRIVIDMDEEVKFNRGRLTQPDRLYFDLFDARLSENLASRILPVEDGFLRQIRVGQFRPDVVRVVLDFKNISRYNVFSLPDPYRLVVDILGDEERPPVVAESFPSRPGAPPEAASPAAGETAGDGPEADVSGAGAAVKPVSSDVLSPLPPEPTSDGRYPLSRQLGLAAKRIVIDPGHGGRDPGTISPQGLKEKDLVLDISQRVGRILGQDPDLEVLMTRRSDVFIPLEERTAIANSREADLFVSIHANASRNRRVRGIETYYLNLATSPEAEQVAARENAVTTRRMAELQDILKQIVNNSKIAESREFAHLVQSSLVSRVVDKGQSSRDLGVKTAPFYVLLGANMPSILVEVSFLSNPEDARLLASDAYRDRLAESIAGGILRYSSTLKRVAGVGENVNP